MSNSPTLTVVGNMTADPDLRFGPSGNARMTFTLACTPRVFDRQANEYRDGTTLFMPCVLWGKPAENAAESYIKGDRAIATGRLVQEEYENREGEKRTIQKLIVDELGASTTFRTLRHHAASRQPENRPVPNQQEGGGQDAGGDEPPF